MHAFDLLKHLGTVDVLKDPLNQRLLAAIRRFGAALSLYGHTVTLWTESSLAALPRVEPQKKKEISERFELWSDWIEPEEGGEILDKDDMEKFCLRKILDHCNYELDDAFWKTIEKGQIIEIYGKEMIQIYRSLNFFSITGYSLLDISIHEWFVLWERPKKAVEETMSDVKQVIGCHVPVKPFSVTKQIIIEGYNSGPSETPFTPRAILAEFKNMGSLKTKGDTNNIPVGFICTSTARIVAYGEDIKKVALI